jgi:DNA-binding LacI/PurR family transcriptional regulator
MTQPHAVPRRPVGLREVARAAGVSVASASVALNGRDGVAEQTRQRVLEAARRLGYRANPQARALRRGRTTIYGLMVRNLSNPFFLDVIQGAEEVAGEAGATLLVVDSRYCVERELRHVQEMADQHCAGLAIAPVGRGESVPLWRRLRPGAPAVVLNAQRQEGVPRVGPDDVPAVSLPLHRLHRLGHDRVAFLSAPRRLMADPDRLTAYRRVARALGMPPMVVTTPLTLESVQQRMTTVLAGPDRPTAVITNSDYTAHAVYKAARGLGIGVGTDLAVVGHDDLPTSELLDPPLATLRLDRRALGRALMHRLLDPAWSATTSSRSPWSRGSRWTPPLPVHRLSNRRSGALRRRRRQLRNGP